ncbi:MAG: nucleotide-binding universal stress UspA family protein [Cyclobacteriaceae bacterium]|jgi:nucleotide-binding universal stress UspA family protein
MNTIKKILLPIDFSDSSLNAIKYVIGLAKNDTSVKCDLIYIGGETLSEGDQKIQLKKLQELKSEYFNKAHVNCDVLVKTGDLNQVILDAKEDREADLIIMGTSGSTGDKDSSNTSELLAKADCPVLVIPKNNSEFKLKNIALAIDDKAFDDSSNLGIIHDFARWFDAKVHLLTVENENSPAKPNSNAETLEYYLDTLDYRHSFEKNTDIEKGLNDYINQKEIDILAIMPRMHAKNSEPSEGRLTKTLALNCIKPLLVID